MKIKTLTPNEMLKIHTERQIIANELHEYLFEKYCLEGLIYTGIWMDDQKLVKHFNKFGSIYLK